MRITFHHNKRRSEDHYLGWGRRQLRNGDRRVTVLFLGPACVVIAR